MTDTASCSVVLFLGLNNKMKNNKRVWFEVRVGGGSTNHYTKGEAEAKLAEMKKGYPKNAHMSEESHAYWKKASSKAEIYRVVQTEEKL